MFSVEMIKQSFSIQERGFADRAFFTFKNMNPQEMLVTVYLFVESSITFWAFVLPYVVVFVVLVLVLIVVFRISYGLDRISKLIEIVPR